MHASCGRRRARLGAAAPGKVAGEAPSLTLPRLRGRVREGAILELLDLVRRPALRHADERVWDRAFGEVIELPELAACGRYSIWSLIIVRNSRIASCPFFPTTW